MSQVVTKKHLTRASLWPADDPRTVLLRMAANQERAERLRLLKRETPGVTWRQLAEYVDVVERSVYDWLKTGAMEFDNAAKVAEFFTAHGRATDTRWFYFGEAVSPDLMTQLREQTGDGITERLTRIEAMLAELLARTAAPATPAEDVAPGTVEKAAGRTARRRPPGGQQRSV